MIRFAGHEEGLVHIACADEVDRSADIENGWFDYFVHRYSLLDPD
jgi:hypothetical protein